MSLILGRKFNRLLVLGQWLAPDTLGRNSSVVLCQCDCGQLKELRASQVAHGRVKSCGCLQREAVSKRHRVHGKSRTPLYTLWASLRQRCDNPKNPYYRNYGARGITVCDRWRVFGNFLDDMGDNPPGCDLDRRDNTKGYFKENCRWVSRETNLRNTRASKWWFLRGVRYESKTHAAEALSVHPRTITNWCNGYARDGGWVSPKAGCRSELKYL